MKLQRKKLFLVFAIGTVAWVVLSFALFSGISHKMERVATAAFGHLLGKRLDEAQVVRLLGRETYNMSSIAYPLKQMMLSDFKILNYFHLPLRKYSASFSEITTANRDTSYPLAPDFTFHIAYTNQHVTLYEDYGPGCVYRFYLLPWLSTDFKVLNGITAKDLKSHKVIMMLDDEKLEFSVDKMMEGKEWPFLSPLNTQTSRAFSGMGSYTPFCYQNSLIITYHPPQSLPANLFEKTVNCSLQDLLCPVHIYSSISRHKFPMGTQVQVFNMEETREMSMDTIERLKEPQENGPDAWQDCTLDCMEMCSECSRTIYTRHYAGVIVGMKVRVFETATGRLIDDWSQLLISITFDDAREPQVNGVPLGTLFGAAGSLNDFKGSVVGRRKRTCYYADTQLDLPRFTSTGYIYFPMPFWQSATITISGASSITTSLLLCAEITVMQNFYNQVTSAYFHAKKSYYNASVEGWRNILDVTGSWGHVVGVYLDIDNLYPVPNAVSSNTRWAALQSDPALFIDGRKAASMLGTGLEDYFSYSHGFINAANSTYSFLGLYHSNPETKIKPLTWYCYRFHVLDPIPYHHSIRFILDGTSSTKFNRPERPISFEEHEDIKKGGSVSAFGHLVLYYSRRESGLEFSSKLILGDLQSEAASMLKCSPSLPDVFKAKRVRYLGASHNNRSYNVTGRSFRAGHQISFSLKVQLPNNGVMLRRDFYATPKVWNFKANIRVNNQDSGVWYIPMGTLNEKYCLMQDEFLIGPKFTNQNRLDVVIEPLTEWNDVSYQVLVIL